MAKQDPDKQSGPYESETSERKRLQLARSALSIGRNVAAGSNEQALHKALLTGIKMASHHPFHDPLVSPITLAGELKKLGVGALTWSPETLCAEIDRKYNGWDEQKVSDALKSFHASGIIKTDVPQLVREKLYAIRVVATSDTAHTEWHVFEKVGGAFNDRTAKFGTVEPLSAAECARTIAVMENIRPDSYSDEVKIYVAACCHEYGLLTVEPLSWLSMSERYLQRMNQDATGEALSPKDRETIKRRFDEEKKSPSTAKLSDELTLASEDTLSIQVAKLLSIDFYATDIIRG